MIDLNCFALLDSDSAALVLLALRFTLFATASENEFYPPVLSPACFLLWWLSRLSRSIFMGIDAFVSPITLLLALGVAR